MSLTYEKQPDDKQYRLVSLMVENVGPWMDFTDKIVDYPEKCVVEVMHEDGTTSVEYELSKEIKTVGVLGNKIFFKEEDIPVARMWLQSKGGMRYKVPFVQTDKDGRVYILIPHQLKDVALCGDRYFDKVYALSIS